MLSERDAIRLWQQLFRGQAITALTLNEAESVVDRLPSDSPVRVRLSAELEEVRRLKESRT
jgi:hypothetical protein